MKDLILFRGLPGSGKTALARLMTYNNVAADNFVEGEWDATKIKEYHAKCKAQTESLMEKGWSPIAVHNTFTREWEMRDYFLLAQRYGYRVHTVIVENRHGSESVHDVPVETMRRMRDRFEITLVDDKALVDVDPFDITFRSLQDVLDKMKNVDQRRDYHPEGSVYKHTMLVLGQALVHSILHPELVWAALIHDMGKIDTTKVHPKHGYLMSPGHDKVSADKYLPHFANTLRLMPASVDYDCVEWIVRQHMRVQQIDKMRQGKQDALRNHEWFYLLETFTVLDDMVRLFKETTLLDRQDLIDEAREWLTTL